MATGSFKMTPFQIAKENPFKEITRYDASMRSRDYDNQYAVQPESEAVNNLRIYESKGESLPNYHIKEIIKSPGPADNK